MRVFVTGATGFIGFAIVKELVGAGHQVTGLARSEASGQKLVGAGAKAQVGSIEDLAGLRRAAANADGAIHTAFYHKPGHIPLRKRLGVILGGPPSAIAERFMAAAVASDRAAVQAIGESLSGSDRPLVATFGTLSMAPGRLATEDQHYDPGFVGAPRAETEDTLQQMASHGVRTSAIRLPPIVHGPGDHGFASRLIGIARKKKASAYVGDGLNRWPSVHRDDVARLYRLALENGPGGGTYHGVAEEGIPFREIAGLLGKRLNLPLVTKTPAEAARHFSFLSLFVGIDNPTSSRLTQERLGWRPTERGLMEDLEKADYFAG